MIHSIHTIQIIHTVRTVHTHSLFFRSDPKKGRTGSSFYPPGRSGSETQHVPLLQRRFHLYVVLFR
ncbi:hypothetical protein MA78_004733 [Salmonella enterica subsp. enterica]|nr:hypothetical protein [Salmonella enterica subsp. enterica serovar Javiana]